MMGHPQPDEIAVLLTGAARIRDSLSAVSRLFSEAGLQDPVAEARALFRALPRPEHLRFERLLDMKPADQPELLTLAPAWILRRLSREPLDRIVGRRAFWTLDLDLSPATLSPRADTETIVSAALEHVGQRPDCRDTMRILDLGTGSGAILLALLSEWPEATGLGVDIAKEAIDTARLNAVRNDKFSPGLSSRVHFKVGSWLESVTGTFDIIVSNPPYIPTQNIDGLDIEVRAHDPLLALDGGPDGLDAYRSILSEVRNVLSENGLIFLEIGQGMAEAVNAIAVRHGLQLVGSHHDLGGILRVLAYRR